jgi:predicted GNAT family N-acyltransferase
MRQRDGDDPAAATDAAGHPLTGAGLSLAWPLDLREAVAVGDDVIGIRPQVCRSSWALLTPEQAHGLARLRQEVGLVETGVARTDLDDQDLDPRTEHLWIADGAQPVACLRVLRPEHRTPLIDRACARADVRRLGLTGALVGDVLARYGAGWVRALAGPATVPFFLKHGFEVHPDARDDGGHLLMVRHPEVPWWD